MDRAAYYQQMMKLAQEQRQLFGIEGARVLKSDLRKMLKHHGVHVDLWPLPCMLPRKPLKNLRGAYMNALEGGPCVMVSRDIPDEPQIFTMAHELKHHLADQELINAFCHAGNISDVIEIGAEVFAAELIYPQQLFANHMDEAGIELGKCGPQHIVDLKRRTNTTLSYAGLAKRAEFLKYAQPSSLKGVKWKKLEESMYGEPVYKRVLRYKRSNNRI